jgi:Multiubiquitin
MTTADVQAKQEVRIHIERTPYRSPNPTYGDALYDLGNVKSGFDLYQEVEGNEEDRLVPRGKEKIHLDEDEHFYSMHPHKKVFTIILNGREKEVDHKVVSFAEVVALANLPGDENTIFTVTYKKGRRGAEGAMVDGDTVKIKNGMIFNVTPTSKS